MTSRPFDVELSLRQHGASLRQLAAELLRDPDAADDAVQEVWAAALQRPPRHAGSPGGWLATALRNVVRKLRRGERRRVAREGIASRGDAAEDHAAVLAREELLHRLVAEVSALDAPFRAAIWQRYFEGMAPRDIARASGVPVATVKSRLQRGLQQLRAKLGEDGESDWRGALAVAFGLKDGAVGTTATAWSGALLMTAWTKVMAAVAVVGLAGVLLWSLRDANVAPPSANIVAVDGVGATVPGAMASPANRQEVASPTGGVETGEAVRVAVPPPKKNATLRGRCVDERGAAIARCSIELDAFQNTRLMEVWQREHGKLPPTLPVPAQSTGVDGTFVFEFTPSSPFTFSVRIEKDAFAAMS